MSLMQVVVAMGWLIVLGYAIPMLVEAFREEREEDR